VKRELVLFPAAVRVGLLGMTLGALLGEMLRKKARTVALGCFLGLLLAVMQTDARRHGGRVWDGDAGRLS
jgi:uncharacterized membrane protein YfcA